MLLVLRPRAPSSLLAPSSLNKLIPSDFEFCNSSQLGSFLHFIGPMETHSTRSMMVMPAHCCSCLFAVLFLSSQLLPEVLFTINPGAIVSKRGYSSRFWRPANMLLNVCIPDTVQVQDVPCFSGMHVDRAASTL